MDRCRRLAERLYNIENPVGPQPSTNRSQPSSAADPTLAAIIIFLNRSDANLARRAKSLLSSFFFCARTDLFLGRLRAPPDGFNNPPDTRNRPGERFFCTSSPRPVFDRTGDWGAQAASLQVSAACRDYVGTDRSRLIASTVVGTLPATAG